MHSSGPSGSAPPAAAQDIRAALAQVAQTRAQTSADPALAQAVSTVKALQARRFAGSYADLLDPDQAYAPAARFFLCELYSDQDFSERDAQFARIAGAVERLFPHKVAQLAQTLAGLHALTEALDQRMGQAWLAQPPLAGAGPAATAACYVRAWRQVGAPAQRQQQLSTVLGIGRELAQLTRLPGLRTLLRMMRSPAQRAGLAALQAFLERGFDTFAALTRAPGGADGFLTLIEQRERALLDRLFEADPVSCETHLQHILGLAR